MHTISIFVDQNRMPKLASYFEYDIKVIDGDKGLFIAMPSRRAGDGEYRDIAHPINSDMRDRLQSEILAKYEEAVKESRENETAEE